jgi:hypothetical protein
MSSLILHGDLSQPTGDGPDRELYVRPVLCPQQWNGRERVPSDQLWIDLVHRAVRRIIEGDTNEVPAAPSVRIVNFSIGDSYQPFLRSMSSIAKLIDWLSWKYRLLFVVSAGNHFAPLKVTVPGGSSPPGEADVLRALQAEHRHRRLLAPSEAVNVLTVGASHEDGAGAWASPSPNQGTLLTTEGLPSLFSALGRGFRRAVKPDLLAPGGRAVFNRQPVQQDGVAMFEPAVGPTLPGQLVAAPGKTTGDLGATEFTAGTSNAAAVTTRLSAAALDVVEVLQQEQDGTLFSRLPPALVTKAIAVHTASWNPLAFGALSAALKNDQNKQVFRDLAAGFLGYGRVRPDRAVSCTAQRATFLSGGFIKPGQQWIHQLPLPSCLHAQSCRRRLTVTLTWFTPINPRSRQYRCISVFFTPPAMDLSPLDVKRLEVDGKAVSRGTVQHEVLEGVSTAMDIPADGALDIPVSCFEDAPLTEPLPADGIPYALAVTLEVAPKTALPIYEQVRARIQPRVKVGAYPWRSADI